MRIGLVGNALPSGIGLMTADVHELAPWAHAWLVVPHRRRGIDARVADRPGVRHVDPEDPRAGYRRFLREVDGVLFVERPYFRTFDPAAEAQAAGRFVACIPMNEWLDPDDVWLDSVDLMWAPTHQAHRELRLAARYRIGRFGAERTPWAERIRGGRWGVDPLRFAHRPRKRCETFLFVNGRGGYLGRKGAALVAEAARRAPELRVLVRSQVDTLPPMPEHVEVRVGDLREREAIYAEGDVLLAPSAWEGFGMQLYEAQACGLPVLTTAAPPMNECGGLLVPVARTRFVETCRWVRRYEADPGALAAAMRRLAGRPLEVWSGEARRRIEARHDLRDVLSALGRELEALHAGRRGGA